MATHAEQRANIVSSVFSRLDETYVSHIKIWEDAGPEGRKPRYIILSRAANNTGFLHKSKLNTNGTYSVGKTWRLAELRGLQVLSTSAFNITLSRTYRWDTENNQDQITFIEAAADLFQDLNPGVNLRVEGLSGGSTPSKQPVQNGYTRSTRSPSPTHSVTSTVNGRSQSRMRRPQTPPSRNQDPDPPIMPRSQSRAGMSRAGSPSMSQRQDGLREPYPRPSSAASNASSSRPPRPSGPSVRRPANGVPPSSSQSSLQGELGRSSPDYARSRSMRSRPSSPTNSVTSSRKPPSAYPPRDSPARAGRESPAPSIGSRRESPPRPSRVNGRESSPPRSRREPSRARRDPSPPRSRREPSPPLSRREPSPPPRVRREPSPPPPRVRREPSPPPRVRRGASPPAVTERESLPETRPTKDTTPLRRRPSSPDARARRDPNARISFFDPTNQATLDRVLAQGPSDGDAEEESTQVTMAAVEEMIEGYEWASDDVIGRRTVRGAAELIEKRLLDELTALDRANVHSFLETDDRVAIVMKFMDEALAELDNMESLVSSYKIHLNNVGDDISFIQSQNRGLQVQTQNQRALLTELESLLKTVQVNKSALVALTKESLEKSEGIQRLEEAAAQLYKALQAGRDTDMAASMERLQEYKTHNAQFCKRILDFLTIMSTAQGKLLLGETNGVLKDRRGRPTAVSHGDLEAYLGRYAGLMLFLKEMDENIYGKLCAAYFSASSELANAQIRTLFAAFLALVRKAKDDESEQSFHPSSGGGLKAVTGMRRAGTLIRSPMENNRKDKEKESGDMKASEVFSLLLEQLAPLIYREDEFIADFLQINDAALTFADYMNLDNYFKRQASRSAGLSQTTLKLVRGSMDLIFGFLPQELKAWLDEAIEKDAMQLFGLLGCLERFLTEANEQGNQFLQGTLEKQHTRMKALLDRHFSEQVRQVEATKLANKKRRGVVHFIKYFPVYISRVEAQMIGADVLEVRGLVDSGYERIVQSMFDCLKQIAKIDSGEGEDKGQLAYHLMLIENAHHFVSEMSQIELGSVRIYVQTAEAIYDESVGAYVKMVLRRPFGKIIDYFEGIERLLKTSGPAQVSTNSSYNKSALKKITKDYTVKDVRKHVETLAKRIEKQFSEGSDSNTASAGSFASGTPMAGVWKALEEELLRITDLFVKRIGQCYADSGITLDYSRADVEAMFKKHRFT